MAPPQRKRAWKRKAKELRKSNKLWAEGAREAVMRPHIEPYSDALERGWRAERDYLQKVCNEYHTQISWRLRDHEEPELPLPVYNPNAPAPTEVLSDEDRAARHTRLEELNVRIRRWLKYRAQALRRKVDSKADGKSPLTILLSKLAGVKAPPKARQGYQQYMHESYKTMIKPEVERLWSAQATSRDGAANTAKANAAFRAKVARDLFAELPEATQEAIRIRGKDEARKQKSEYDLALKNGPKKTPEFRQRCIDNLGPFVGAFMKGLQEYTGLQGVLVMGGPIPKYGGQIGTIHLAVGRNLAAVPVAFPAWNKDRFSREVVDFMKEYLETAYTADECAESALPPATSLDDALYKFDKDAEADIDDDDLSSSSDTDSDESSDSDSDSDAGSDVSDEEGGGKPKKKVAAKGKGKGKGKGVEKTKEKDATAGKRKRAEVGEGARAAKKAKGPEPEPRMEGPLTEEETKAQAERDAARAEERAVAEAEKKKKAAEAEAERKRKKAEAEAERKRKAAEAERQQLARQYEEGKAANKRRNDALMAALDLKRTADEVLEGLRPTKPVPKPRAVRRRADAPIGAPRRSARTNRGAGDVEMGDGGGQGEGDVEMRDVGQEGDAEGDQDGRELGAAPDVPLANREDYTAGARNGTHAPTPTTPTQLTCDVTPAPPTPARDVTPAPPTPTRDGTPTPPAPRLSTEVACPGDAPAWFQHGFGAVSHEELGAKYRELLDAFVDLEKGYGFESGGKLPVDKARPAQVSEWIKDGRGRNKSMLPIPDIAAFEARWWAWWGRMQPAWRAGGAEGKLQRVEDASGSWEPLIVPGQNGLLSVVATLYWWGTASKAGTSAETAAGWEAAVEDVTWAMRRLRAAYLTSGA